MGYLETVDGLLPGIGVLGRAENAQRARDAAEAATQQERQRREGAQRAIKNQQERTMTGLGALGLSDTSGCTPAVIRAHNFVAGGVQAGDLLFTATSAGVMVYAAPDDGQEFAFALGTAYTPGQLWFIVERVAQVRDGKAEPDAVGLPSALVAPVGYATPEALIEAAILRHTRDECERRRERQEREDAEWQRRCDGLVERMADTLGVRLVHTDLTRLTVVGVDEEVEATVIATYGDLRFTLDERGTLGVVRFCPQCEVVITSRTPIYGLGSLGDYLANLTIDGQPLGDPPVCDRCLDPLSLLRSKPAPPKPPAVAERLEQIIREIAYSEAQSARGDY